MAELMYDNNFCLAWKAQSGWGTPATEATKDTWSWLKASKLQWTPEREIEDLDLPTGQIGADDHPAVGARKGSWSFRVPLTSQANGYSGTPAETQFTNLINQFLIGLADGGAKNAGEIDDGGTTDANTWQLKPASAFLAKIGCAYSFGNDTDGMQGVGWVESQAGGAGTDITLFMDTRAVPDDSSGDSMSDLYGMLTYYPTTGNPTPFTLREIGPDTDQDIRLIDCVIGKIAFSLDAGKRVIAEISGRYYDSQFAKDGGFSSLTYPPDDLEVPPITGTNNGRAVISTSGVTTFDDGTADPVGTCGLEDLSVEIEADLVETPCHAARHVGSVKYANFHCRINVSVPFDQATDRPTELVSDQVEADYTAFQTKLEQSLSSGAAAAFAIEVGDTAGAMFAILVPQCRVNEQWSVGASDHKVMFGAKLSAAKWNSDGASTDAGNTAFRVAFG